MLFVITCLDKPDRGPLRAATRPAHLDHIRAEAGRIAIAGPLLAADGTTPVGSLLIIDFPDRAAVDRFAAADPYAKAGLFESVTVRAFRKVFPEQLQ
jgi:uncharacterized protein